MHQAQGTGDGANAGANVGANGADNGGGDEFEQFKQTLGTQSPPVTLTPVQEELLRFCQAKCLPTSITYMQAWDPSSSRPERQ